MNKLIINNWDKFHNLTILCETLSKGNYRVFKCKCSCWKIKNIRLWNLTSWNSKSCWCIDRERIGKNSITHGMSNTRFYGCYKGILERCNNLNNKRYKNYWGRGIKCIWKSFEGFKYDMYEEYLNHIGIHWKRNTTIERENNDWNYCKLNCKWATYKEQATNKRNTVLLLHKGETKPLIEWCRTLKLNYSTTYKKDKRFNWDVIKIFTKRWKTFSKMREENNMSKSVFDTLRYKKKLSLNEIFANKWK